MIHDGSSRNRQDAMRDGHAERRGTKAYLKQYVEVTRSEPARLAAAKPRPGLSQRRIGGCSRSVHESCGLERPRTDHKSSSFLHRRCWEIPISLAASLSEINSLMPPPHPIERSLWTQPDTHQSPFITACVTCRLTIPSIVPLSSNAASVRF